MLTRDEADVLVQGEGHVVAVNESDIIEFATPGALELLGWQGQLVGRPLTTIIPSRLQPRHVAGFKRYVQTGESRLAGKTVRVPARRQNGTEIDVDLTIRVFRRPDASVLCVAALSLSPRGQAPPSLIQIEGAFAKRLYELI